MGPRCDPRADRLMAAPDLLTRLRGKGPDLLTRVRGELDARLRELRPLLAEYERLLIAASALDDAGEDGEQTPAPVPAPIPTRGRPRAKRAPARTKQARASTAPVSVPASSAPRRAGGVPKPAPKRAQRGATGVAILAALEHGSHTASELVIVTAIGGPIIHNNLRRLQQAGAITRTKRAGDGKAAYALASTPA
jgi:hypothetical protein